MIYYYYLSVQVQYSWNPWIFFCNFLLNICVCCLCCFSGGFLSALEMAQTCDPLSLSSAVPVSILMAQPFFLPSTSSISSYFTSLYFLLCIFLPSVLWLAECSVHGITTVCVSTAVQASALVVPMSTNTMVCQQLLLTLTWLLHSKKTTESFLEYF